MGAMGGGLNPFQSPRRLYSRARGRRASTTLPMGWLQGPMAPPLGGGEYTREKARRVAVHLFPGASPQMAPQILGDRQRFS